MTKNYAHRGFSRIAPENTLAAFRAAIEIGADGCELDVHMTQDGELVVIHDETVDRTTDGEGWIKDLSFDDIRSLDAGSWFSPVWAGERIPTLREVLALFRGTRLQLNIELKTNIVAYPGMAERVIKEVEGAGMGGQVIMASFNHVSLYHLHLDRPHMQLGVLYDESIPEVWDYAKQLGASAIHPNHLLVTEELVSRCHQHRIHVRPYTIDDETEMKRLIRFGVDAVITNVPDRLKEVLTCEEYCEQKTRYGKL